MDLRSTPAGDGSPAGREDTPLADLAPSPTAPEAEASTGPAEPPLLPFQLGRWGWPAAGVLGLLLVLVLLFSRRAPGPAAAVRFAASAAVLEQEGKLDLALVELGKAIGVAPRSPAAHRQLGALLARKGLADAAEAAYRAALDLEDDAVTRINAGILDLRRGRNEAAAQHFQRAVDLAPGMAVAHLDLCVALLRAGRATEAIAACRRASELDPKNLDAKHNLGYAYRMTGQHDQAIATLTEVLAAEPGRVISLFELGCAYADSGRTDQARETLRRLLQIEPDHGAARDRLARLGG